MEHLNLTPQCVTTLGYKRMKKITTDLNQIVYLDRNQTQPHKRNGEPLTLRQTMLDLLSQVPTGNKVMTRDVLAKMDRLDAFFLGGSQEIEDQDAEYLKTFVGELQLNNRWVAKLIYSMVDGIDSPW